MIFIGDREMGVKVEASEKRALFRRWRALSWKAFENGVFFSCRQFLRSLCLGGDGGRLISVVKKGEFRLCNRCITALTIRGKDLLKRLSQSFFPQCVYNRLCKDSFNSQFILCHVTQLLHHPTITVHQRGWAFFLHFYPLWCMLMNNSKCIADGALMATAKARVREKSVQTSIRRSSFSEWMINPEANLKIIFFHSLPAYCVIILIIFISISHAAPLSSRKWRWKWERT